MPADPTPADRTTGATEPGALAAEPRDPDGQTPTADSDDITLAEVSDGEAPPDMTDSEVRPDMTDREVPPDMADREVPPDMAETETPAPDDGQMPPDVTGGITAPDVTDGETATDADDDRSREPLVPEPSGYQSRWDTIQAGFVDEPRRSVAEADALVAEVIDEITDAFAGARAALEAQWSEGGEASTEELRQAFRRYRSFFQRLLTT